MSGTVPVTPPASGGAACVPPDPCAAACYIENALLAAIQSGGRTVKQVTYEGRTTIWDRAYSLSDLRELLNYYKAKCAAICPADPAAQGPARAGPMRLCGGGIVPRGRC